MLKDYFDKYDAFVRTNPRLAAEIEAIIRWSSYLVATKKSPALGELLSSGANLLQLCNDIILRQGNTELKLNLKSCATQLKTFLSVVQSLELFVEIYARDNYSNTAKWVIITVIQITKATIKLILLLIFDDGITKSQSLIPLDRIHYAEIVKLQEKYNNCGSDHEHGISNKNETLHQETKSKSIVLKSSGRRMRSITDAPPKEGRFSGSRIVETPSPFGDLQKKRLKILIDRYREHTSATLTERQLYGEILHISRPIAHLLLMGAFGTQSWISYMTSLTMDISSIYLVKSPWPIASGQSNAIAIPENYRFNANERMEMGQRASSLLLYLLRSPFFDEYTKRRALEGLASTVEHVPLFGQFLATFINYIPDWQQQYFRIWSG